MRKSKLEIGRGSGSIGHNRTVLEQIPLAQLRLIEGDPRKYGERDIDLAVGVLRQLPTEAPLPVVANDRNEVLVGGLFVAAARKMGQMTMLVIRHDGLSKTEQKHYAVAINQLLSKGDWDPLALDAWVREFEAELEDFNHTAIGFEAGELDRVLGMTELVDGLGEADTVPRAAEITVTRPGMKWLAGAHHILCGSATSKADVERLMDGQVAAMAITDPPYGCKVDGFVSKKGRHRDFVEGAGEKGPEELEEFFQGFAAQLLEASRPGSLIYIFIDWRSLDVLLGVCKRMFGPLVQMCCWVKDRAGMGSFYRSQHELVLVLQVPGGKRTNNVKLGANGRNRSNVWQYPCAASSRSGREGDMLEKHPTPKGVEMIADAILDCTNRGDRVIDCFLGSGTTLIAAERTGRVCHAMELDPLYVDVAIRRWQAWTGEGALDVETGKTFDELAAEAAQQDLEGDHEQG